MIKPTSSYLNNTYIEVPSLYRQLVEALDSRRGAAVSSIARSRPPMWVEAEDQRANIDLMVSVWPTGSAGNTVKQLRALADKNWPVEQTRWVSKMARIINLWCADIVTLLNEEHAKHLRDKDEDGRWHYQACPACGASTVDHEDSAGEHVRQPALRIVTEYGATCYNCGHYWAPQAYIELSKQLGGALPAGVLE